MSRTIHKTILLALLLTIASASACTSLLGSFDVGGGGTGGAGGTTATGGSTTTTTTSDCSQLDCCTPADCPTTSNECLAATCTKGVCGFAPEAEGKPVTTQTPGDCRQIVCDGQGATKQVPLATDPLDDGLECTADTCDNGDPVNSPIDKGTACPATASHYCDGAGACVECVAGDQCATGVCGVDGACLPASCNDGVKNGDETAVDCGGSCNGCDTGQPCGVAGDCYNGVCDMSACAAPTCADGVENGGVYLAGDGETDVDCGGPCGATCGPMKACKVDGDCVGGQCSGSMCVPNCNDGVKNNAESDVDCGGSCGSTCTPGQTCGVATDCASGFCADGVCCDTACTGECQACTAALKGAGVDGECGSIPAGTDPENECDPEPGQQCGNTDGLCSGGLGCNKVAAGTACGDSPACAAGVQTNQDTCSGTGACTDAGTVACGLYACGGVTCNSMCSSDVDCASNAYCSMGSCVAKQPLGSACAAGNACSGGNCVDGVCCDSACSGSCKACNVAGAVGMCSFIPSGTDPGDSDCPGASLVCNGAGACKKTQGTACAAAGECVTGNCADGFCCDGACNTLCQACSAAKTAGVNGTCANVTANTDPDNECNGTTSCNGFGFCTTLANGNACAMGTECTSTFCVDGYCCNNPCLNTCQACSAAKKGSGSNGSCGNIASNTDPDNECATECNGSGQCEFPQAQACTLNTQCQSGACVDGYCCDTACSGVCQGCSNAKTGAANGTCANIKINTDPDNDCAGVTNCNGAGACTTLATGTACTVNGECASGFCVDGFCCGSACTFSCQACSNAKTGSANGTCANVKVSTDPDSECPGNTNCNGLGQCGLFTNGTACSITAECTSANCVDGVCCNTACGALCQACTAAKTGGANGTCANVTNATDPDSECAGVTNCNGAGACTKLANGTACTLAAECTSNNCVDGVCCNTACGALCQACTAAKTGGTNGTCANVVPGTDPDNECTNATPNCAAGSICGP
ncbi:MAG: hypothetical protein U0441_24130 [Polyangiaceae bacterium]